MEFPAPLVRGVLIRRYKRFLADVRLEGGETATAHCPNTGAMLGVREPGSEVWLSPAAGRGRKLAFTWELVRADGGLVGINTQHPNRIVAEAIEEGRVPELGGYAERRREVRYGSSSRVDILLRAEGRADCYVEIKNVHLMREPGVAEFPDAVSARAAKHQAELAAAAAAGSRAVVFYLCQRQDCRSFRLAADIDPAYAAAAAAARGRGVEQICYGCVVTPERIRLGDRIEIAA